MPRQSNPNDAYARSMGYPDAATMLAWRAKQTQRLNGGVPQTSSGQGNWFNQILNSDAAQSALSWHPAYTLQRVLDAWPQ